MPSLTARDWTIAAALRLAADGADHVRVERLAQTLGVSKGSFYWHFADRAALLTAVLEMWEHEGTERIIADVDATDLTPEQRLRTLVTRTFGEPQFDGIELGIRAWARHDASAREAAIRVDARRLSYVARLIHDAGIDAAAAGERAALLYRTLMGEFVLRAQGHEPLDASALEAVARHALSRPSS